LLRHPLAISTIGDLCEGEFLPVIDEIDTNDIAANKVKRLVFCSGKVYYDLLELRRSEQQDDVAIVRMEQLYPFPYDEMKAVVSRYPNATSIVWCQEEPRNQGAWRANRHRIERTLPDNMAVEYAGRGPSASPAVGYNNVHLQQQKQLVQEALGLVENTQQTN